jgi:hypothetical protein
MDPGQHAAEGPSPFAGRGIIERTPHRNRRRSIPVQGKDLGRPRGFCQRIILSPSNRAGTSFNFFPFHSSKCFQPEPLPHIMRVKVV